MADQPVYLHRVSEIFKIFQNKGWMIGNKPNKHLIKAFEKTCEISNLIDQQQFEMFATLLANYIRIDVEAYAPSLSGRLYIPRRAVDRSKRRW